MYLTNVSEDIHILCHSTLLMYQLKQWSPRLVYASLQPSSSITGVGTAVTVAIVSASAKAAAVTAMN
jgi:hypothetical protein